MFELGDASRLSLNLLGEVERNDAVGLLGAVGSWGGARGRPPGWAPCRRRGRWLPGVSGTSPRDPRFPS